MSWPCFLIEYTGQAMQTLRRYAHRDVSSCPLATGYHDAEARIEDIPWQSEYNGTGDDDWPHNDPRWPATCACGYTFQLSDAWQHNTHKLFKGQAGGQPFSIRNAPIGAMWLSAHIVGPPSWVGPDGLQLSVMTPGGMWCIDQESQGGGRWTRTGTPPLVTATPSINIIGNYHGWLVGGELSSDIEGRTYPEAR